MLSLMCRIPPGSAQGLPPKKAKHLLITSSPPFACFRYVNSFVAPCCCCHYNIPLQTVLSTEWSLNVAPMTMHVPIIQAPLWHAPISPWMSAALSHVTVSWSMRPTLFHPAKLTWWWSFLTVEWRSIIVSVGRCGQLGRPWLRMIACQLVIIILSL